MVVRAQVRDPDFGIEIGGWQGRVSKVRSEDKLVCIDWDSHTLMEMPSDFIS